MGPFLLSLLAIVAFVGAVGRADAVPPARAESAPEAGLVSLSPAAGALLRAAMLDASDAPAGPRKTDPDSLGVELEAEAAVLLDAATGEVLYAHGHDAIRPIASITKLMTALVALDAAPDWDAPVTISDVDEAFEGIPYFKPGDAMTFREAFDAMLVGSANNAAMAVARSAAPSREEFVARMNRKAAALGLFHTRFADPTGYLPENVSTTFDVARLSRAAFAREEIRGALARKETTARVAGVVRRVPSTNALLGSFLNEDGSEVVAGKTGHTDEAGYALTMQVRRGKADVIAVALGAPTAEARFQDLKSLVAWGFRAWEWP
jgi:D-alanyl-D-alanine carboxypeptidase